MNAQTQIIKVALDAGILHHYRKTGEVTARAALVGERIETRIGGVVETTNRAAAGDIVVTGSQGEQYILNSTKFRERYADTGRTANGERVYIATGECWAVEYLGPQSFEFLAPWGEPMLINAGDYMCTTHPRGENGDIYRVERDAFHATYVRA